MPTDLILFATIATAIVIEAAPFLLLGCLLSAVFEHFAPAEGLEKMLPRSAIGQIAAGCFAGVLLPTCECGVVPVVRRFLAKGVPPRTAMAFMLAAPVANPVVLASTWVAFRGDLGMLLGRLACVLLPAILIGARFGGSSARSLLRQGLDLDLAMGGHGPGCGCGCPGDSRPRGLAAVRSILSGAGSEFLHMAAFLIAGSLAAAAIKTFLPASWLAAVAVSPLLAIPAMMLLAVLLSVCSEADAFVAASFVTFPASARLAFIGLGPMLDLKLIPLYLAVFSPRLAKALLVVPVLAVLVVAILFGLLIPGGA